MVKYDVTYRKHDQRMFPITWMVFLGFELVSFPNVGLRGFSFNAQDLVECPLRRGPTLALQNDFVNIRFKENKLLFD
jgi:hypothetical protein